MKQLVVAKLSPNKMITNNGYLICTNAVLARTGKQQYLKSEIYEDADDDEIIEVDRKPEQVFADATITSFENVPLTCEHPYENVTPENYKDYSVGYVRDVHKGKYNGQDVLLGTLVVCDPQCIQDIKNGYRTELSCGYDCDITEGDHPQQINIRGNHVALCEQGRAGIAKIVDSLDTNNYFEVQVNDSYKKFASLKGAMEFCRQTMDDSIDNELVAIYKNTNGSKELFKTLVDNKCVNDADLAVGSIYIDQNGQTWQIAKVEGDKYIVNIDETNENKIAKTVFEKMIGKELKPSTELHDSYIGSHLGRKIYKFGDNKFKALDRKGLIVADSLNELKDAITNEEKTFKDEISRNRLVELENSLSAYLGANDIYPENLNFTNTKVASDLFVELYFSIDGDWKHDHLFARNLVEKWCEENGFAITGSSSQEIGNSDSDWYEAEYKFYIALDKEKGNAIKHLITGDSRTNHLNGSSKQFYKKLSEVLNDNLEELSEEEVTLDSDTADDYVAQRNRVKRELRKQIQEYSNK